MISFFFFFYFFLEHQGFLSHNTPAPLLYQYLMDHPPPSMKKLSMSNGSINPQDVSENEEEEYAVVNLIPRSAVYKDNKGDHIDMMTYPWLHPFVACHGG